MFRMEAKSGDSTRVAILTCDLLRPLLRGSDMASLAGAEVLYVEANNRFPWPKSGHWSISSSSPSGYSNALSIWDPKNHPSYLIAPHTRRFDTSSHAYFDEFLSEALQGKDASALFGVLDFVREVGAKTVKVLHYSGYEDSSNYKQPILTDNDLLAWIQAEAAAAGITGVTWEVAAPDDRYTL
jgi:hypothetical protein